MRLADWPLFWGKCDDTYNHNGIIHNHYGLQGTAYLFWQDFLPSVICELWLWNSAGEGNTDKNCMLIHSFFLGITLHSWMLPHQRARERRLFTPRRASLHGKSVLDFIWRCPKDEGLRWFCVLIRAKFHGDDCDLIEYVFIIAAVMIPIVIGGANLSDTTYSESRSWAKTSITTSTTWCARASPIKAWTYQVPGLASLFNTLHQVRPSTFSRGLILADRMDEDTYKPLFWPPLVAENTASARRKAVVVFARIARQDRDTWKKLSL